MQVVGHGVDIVEVSEISRLASNPDGHFVTRCFSDRERLDSGGGINEMRRLAGRFAAKEAVVKALGVGWGDGVGWTDIEVAINGAGAPTIVLHGLLELVADAREISDWLISMSHTDAYAVASVLALSHDGLTATTPWEAQR
jgi:holo-[acyl-carrier protein] synthase